MEEVGKPTHRTYPPIRRALARSQGEAEGENEGGSVRDARLHRPSNIYLHRKQRDSGPENIEISISVCTPRPPHGRPPMVCLVGAIEHQRHCYRLATGHTVLLTGYCLLRRSADHLAALPDPVVLYQPAEL